MNKTTKYILEHQDDLALRTGMEEAYRGAEPAVAKEIREKRLGAGRMFQTDWKRRLQDGRFKAVEAFPWFKETCAARVSWKWPSQVLWNGPDAALQHVRTEMARLELWLLGFTLTEIPEKHRRLRVAALEATLADLEAASLRLRKLAARASKNSAPEVALIGKAEERARVLAEEARAMVAAPHPEPEPEPEPKAPVWTPLPIDDWRPNF